MHHLLQGCYVLAFKDIVELFEGVRPVEVNIFGPLIEVGDCFVDGEFEAESTTVDMDLRFQFIEVRVHVLRFVGLLREIFSCHKASQEEPKVVSCRSMPS